MNKFKVVSKLLTPKLDISEPNICLSPLSTFFNLTLSAILAMGTSSRDVGVLSPVVGLMWGLLLRVGELPV